MRALVALILALAVSGCSDTLVDVPMLSDPVENGKTPAVLRVELSGVHKLDQLTKYTERLAKQLGNVCRPTAGTATVVAVLGKRGSVIDANTRSDISPGFDRCASRHISVQRFPRAKQNGLYSATLRFPH